MADICEYCRSLPWHHVETWRYEKKFWTSSRVSDKIADASEDFRMVVDLSKMMSATCVLCRSVGRLWHYSFGYLRYEPAQKDGIFHGFLHVETKYPSLLWLRGGTFGLLAESQQLHHQAHVNFKILGASIKQIVKEPSGEAPRQRCKPLVHGLHLIDCIGEVVMPAPKDCTYLALSYVWGSSTNNEPCGVFPKLPGRLPRTIQDAIAVTKALGYRFLWVDRYCVDQVDAQIKHEQIRQMWDIYASAHLTIVAASGDGPDRGLPGVSLPRSHLLLEYVVLQVQGLYFTPQIVKMTDEVGSSTWASRAWTFQENFASPRRLYFCESLAVYAEDGYCASDICLPHELVFKVHGHDLGEVLEHSLASKETHPSKFREGQRTHARECIEAYSIRNLTYDWDALNGILGVLDHFSQDHVSPTYHIWGVVVALVTRMSSPNVYEVSIHWYHPEPGVRRENFPSWAPIAWRGAVKHNVTVDHLHIVPIIPSDYSMYIHCKEGLQTIEAYVTSRQIQRDSGRPDAPRYLTFRHMRTLSVDIDWDDPSFPAILQIDDTTDVILPVFWDQSVTKDDVIIVFDLIGMVITTYRPGRHGSISIMLLKPTGMHYERIGLIICDNRDGYYTVRDRRTGVQDPVCFDVDRLMSLSMFASEVRRDIVLG